MGRPFEDKTRIMGDDGYWYYRCSSCGIYKPEYVMGKNSKKPFKVSIYCLDCNREYNNSRKEIQRRKNKEFNTMHIQTTGRHLQLMNYKPIDDIETREALERIGYDTTKPIHLQFAERIKQRYGVDLTFDDTSYHSREDN